MSCYNGKKPICTGDRTSWGIIGALSYGLITFSSSRSCIIAQQRTGGFAGVIGDQNYFGAHQILGVLYNYELAYRLYPCGIAENHTGYYFRK